MCFRELVVACGSMLILCGKRALFLTRMRCHAHINATLEGDHCVAAVYMPLLTLSCPSSRTKYSHS